MEVRGILTSKCKSRTEHLAWSKSSTSRPRARGGHRKGKKSAPGVCATLQRRGLQGRAHIWGCVFMQRRQNRRMARPEGPSRCFGYGSFVEEIGSSSEALRVEPTSPFLHFPNYLLSVQMHEDDVEVYTSVQVHMREVAGVEQFPICLLTCIWGPWLFSY